MMAAVSSFHFIRPGWLMLLPLVVIVWWYWQRSSDPLLGWRRQVNPLLLRFLIRGGQSRKIVPGSLLLAAWIIAVTAIAGPTWKREPSPFGDDATPMMILLKADTSMESPDPAPSRLERARLKITDLAEARKGQPLGLIAYAGSAHLVLPPTRDTAIVADMAAEVGPAIMPVQGDRLDLALGLAARLLGEGGQGGSILVMADSVAVEPAQLKSAYEGPLFPVQFLAVTAAGSSQEASLQAAAKALSANVEPLDVENRDIAALVDRAANMPVLVVDEALGSRWKETGYWLLPVLALLVLSAFRRQQVDEVVQ